jgi:inner membrane transporter RhtA
VAEPALGAPATRAAGGGSPTALALVLTAVASVQFGSALAATLFDRLGPGGAVFLRLGVAALVLLAAWRPRLRAHAVPALRVAAVFGLALGAMNWAFYEAIDRIPLGIAVTFEFIGPLSVALVGSRRRLDLAWVACAAAGILLLADGGGGSGPLDPLGIAFALVAGICWAAYILLSARVGRLFSGGDGLALAMVVGALLTLPVGILDGGAALGEPALLAAGAAVALLSSVIPYSLELEALRRLPEAAFGVLMSLEPAVAALAGFLLLDQVLHTRAVLAVGLVVVASAGATLGARRP